MGACPRLAALAAAVIVVLLPACKGGVDEARHRALSDEVLGQLEALGGDSSRPGVAPWAPKRCREDLRGVVDMARERLQAAGTLRPSLWAGEDGFDAATQRLLEAHGDEVATWASALITRASCRVEGSPLGKGPPDAERGRLAVRLGQAVMALALSKPDSPMSPAVWSVIPVYAVDLPRGRGRFEAGLAAQLLDTWLSLSEGRAAALVRPSMLGEQIAQVRRGALDIAPSYGTLLRRDAAALSAAVLHALRPSERLAPYAGRLPEATRAALAEEPPDDALEQLASFRRRVEDYAAKLAATDATATRTLEVMARESIPDEPLAGTLASEIAFTAPGQAYLRALMALRALAAKE